jgi:oligopeptidase B
MLAAVTQPDHFPSAPSTISEGSGPPAARRGDLVRELHGDRRPDPYAWLRETDQPEVLDYLAAERAYYDAASEPLRAEAERLFGQMVARVAPAERSVAHRSERFAFFTRTPEGAEYGQLCRVPLDAASSGPAWRRDLVLDGPNVEVMLDPATRTMGSSYLELGLTLVSPDENVLAYSVDTTGDEVYRLSFLDLATGEDLAETVERSYYGGAWSADSSTFFYTVHDEKYRPFQVWRHRLGTPVADDTLVLVEDDERYEIELRTCRSGDVIEMYVACRDTTEVWIADAHQPDAPARLVEPRRHGIEYRVEHARTPAGDRLFITTNDDATEYRLMVAPVETPGRDHWVEVVGENPAERLHQATAFDGYVVTTIRRNGSLAARTYPISEDGQLDAGVDLVPGVDCGSLELADNDWYEATQVTVVEQSYVVPKAWYDLDLATGERTLVHQQAVRAYDESGFVTERVSVPVTSGLPWPGEEAAPRVDVPVTIVRRADTPLDGTAPCLIYAYGSYEACDEPAFDPGLMALVDEGVVYAHAHIRGGGEGGRRWWFDGRLERKQNTFTDLIAVADHLADGMVDGDRIITRGLSAGGLLQGAVFSQAPQRWRGVIAEVPFVDVVTTMLDGSIPLTITEWDEWGDPSRPADYAWMKAYSPYDNPPEAGSRPDLLVTGALHDPRVMVFEPAKWVALLRYTDPAWSPRCEFRVELGAGAHVGPSGRYAHLRYEAEIYAWALARF